MDNEQLLKKILQVTLENNKILKEIQEDGIAITMPKYEDEEIEAVPQITEIIKPKISATDSVLENSSNITAWKDKGTNLTWEFKPNDRKNIIMSQMDCNDYVDNLNIMEYSGFNDWRIPTLKELKSLVSDTKTNFSYIKPPLSKNTNYSYWTSTKYDENFYMTINFNTKKDVKSVKANLDYVRCVRGELKTK